MRTSIATALVALGALTFALPAAAAPGDVASIALRDFNHDGRIDRAVVSFANPSATAWSVRGTEGIKVTYQGQPVRLRDAFMASSGAQAELEIVFDESDPNLKRTTSVAGFAVTYAPQGAAAGVSDGSAELAAIAADATLKDEAAPVLLSSDPAAGTFDAFRDPPITLVFSEPVPLSSLTHTSSQNPGEWIYASVGDGSTVSVSHRAYGRGVTEEFGVSAADAAGNALARNSYPNPFTFRTSSANTPAPQLDAVFVITSPVPFETLTAGAAFPIAWYSNDASVVNVRLAYSSDGGQTYTTIATAPAAQGVHVWYPPAMSSAFRLRMEGLTSAGGVANVAFVDTLSLSGNGVPAELRALAGPAFSAVTDTSATAWVDLDRSPASATFSCGSLSLPVVTSGDRPVRLEARLTGLVAGTTYACRFTLTDAPHATVNLDLPTFKAGADTTPPALVGQAVVSEFDPAAGTAVIGWTTDEPSTSDIRYGAYLDYSGRGMDGTLSTSHRMVMTGLTPGALHQVRITSIDAKGNASVTEDWYFVFLREGDLIKSKSSAAVYWYKGGKRYAFPNEDVYRSWFGGDFSKVITVPGVQLGTIALGGNVKMKAGVYLIKIQSDPKTYAVEPDGTLRWIQTESQAAALYGAAWAKRVRDVDVSLFTDYAIGDPLAPGEKPAGYAN